MPWKPRRGGAPRISPSPTTTLPPLPFPSSCRRQIPPPHRSLAPPFHRVHLSAAPDRFSGAESHRSGGSVSSLVSKVVPCLLCSSGFCFLRVVAYQVLCSPFFPVFSELRIYLNVVVDWLFGFLACWKGSSCLLCSGRVDVDSISLVLLPIKC